MTDKELIKQEIERRMNLYSIAEKDDSTFARMGELSSLMDFIDSLPEEPASEDLEEACDNYYDETWDEHGGIAMVVNNCHDIWFPSQATSDFFKAGAEWQKQQMMKDAVDGEYWDGSIYLDNRPTEYKDGDKAKIIIVKEEQ